MARIKIKTCSTCGQIIPPEIFFRNGSVKQRIYDCVSNTRAPLRTEQIAEIVYVDDPDGGPNDFKVITVLICQMNKVLRPKGLHIHANRGRYATYMLEHYDS